MAVGERGLDPMGGSASISETVRELLVLRAAVISKSLGVWLLKAGWPRCTHSAGCIGPLALLSSREAVPDYHWRCLSEGAVSQGPSASRRREQSCVLTAWICPALKP